MDGDPLLVEGAVEGAGDLGSISIRVTATPKAR